MAARTSILDEGLAAAGVVGAQCDAAPPVGRQAAEVCGQAVVSPGPSVRAERVEAGGAGAGQGGPAGGAPQVGVVDGETGQAERPQAQGGAQPRVAVVGEDGEAVEPCALDVPDTGALDEEVEDQGQRQGGEVEAGARIAEDAADDCVYVGGFPGDQCGDECPFRGRANHLSIHDAVVRGYAPGRGFSRLQPRHAWCAAPVLLRLTGRCT